MAAQFCTILIVKFEVFVSEKKFTVIYEGKCHTIYCYYTHSRNILFWLTIVYIWFANVIFFPFTTDVVYGIVMSCEICDREIYCCDQNISSLCIFLCDEWI